MHLSNLTLTFWKAELFPISPSLVLLHFALFIFFHLNTTGNNFRRADGAKLSLASDFCCTFSFSTFSCVLLHTFHFFTFSCVSVHFFLFHFLFFAAISTFCLFRILATLRKGGSCSIETLPRFLPKLNFFLLSKSTFLTQHTFVLPAELIQFVF